MADVVQEFKNKMHELFTWVEQEIHGKVEQDAKAAVSGVVEQAKTQGVQIIDQVANAIKTDINLAEQGVARTASSLAASGETGNTTAAVSDPVSARAAEPTGNDQSSENTPGQS